MLKQQLNLKLSQKLSPQQIQLMKLIQLPTLSFEQKLQQELEENPALEAGKEATENQDFDTTQDDDHNVIETDINVDEYLSDDEIPPIASIQTTIALMMMTNRCPMQLV